MRTFLFLLIFIHAVLFILLWSWAIRKGKTSLRLLALIFGMLTLSFGTILWLVVQEKEILTGTVIAAIIVSLGVLSWRITSPRLLRRMNIKW